MLIFYFIERKRKSWKLELLDDNLYIPYISYIYTLLIVYFIIIILNICIYQK